MEGEIKHRSSFGQFEQVAFGREDKDLVFV